MFSSCFCNHAALRYHVLSTNSFGLIAKGEDTFADDISLRIAVFLGNPEHIDDTVLFADFLKI